MSSVSSDHPVFGGRGCWLKMTSSSDSSGSSSTARRTAANTKKKCVDVYSTLCTIICTICQVKSCSNVELFTTFAELKDFKDAPLCLE